MNIFKDLTWEELQELDEFREEDAPEIRGEDPDLENLYSSGDEEDDDDIESIMTRPESRDSKNWSDVHDDDDQDALEDNGLDSLSDHDEEEEEEIMDTKSEVNYGGEKVALETEKPLETEQKKQERGRKRQQKMTDYMKILTKKAFVDSKEDSDNDSERAISVDSDVDDLDGSDLSELSDMSYNADVKDVSGKMEREINSSKPSPEKLNDFGDRCVLRYQSAQKLAKEYKKEDSNEAKLAEKVEEKKGPQRKKNKESKVKQQRMNEPNLRNELEKNFERTQKQEEEMIKDVKMVLDSSDEDPKIAERQCEQCFKVFVSKNKMQRHMKTHTDQIDANCDICRTPVKYSYNLVHHLKKCAQKLRTPCGEDELKKYYPRFMDEFEKFRADNLSDLPELPADFKFDDLGFIVEKNDPTRFSYTNYEFGKGLKNYEKKKNEEEKEDSDIEKEIASDDEET
ncbi:hypothetical protein CRE_29117 [Caenorhabditis remanei]|uniref:C2H2-type domain-containing protein n=1 Tax=Caenorhabditis remanei TaxID=31234 RepID=E3N4M2_CAERE|nr:hypothetical protein CRE_29117 [Caenorhabditis remanei]